MASITTQGNHQFLSSFDASGKPVWTTAAVSPNAITRTPIFLDANGVGWNVSVTYHPASGRYLLVTEHTTTMLSNIGIFDAPEPWGPWTTLWYQSSWGAPPLAANGMFWAFAPKWFSATAFVLVFTGLATLDAWNSVEGTLSSLTDMPDTLGARATDEPAPGQSLAKRSGVTHGVSYRVH